MPYCNEKMNLRGNMRCTQNVGHDGAHATVMTKAPKRNGKVMRGIIIAGDTLGKKHPVEACSHVVRDLLTRDKSNEERISFLLDVADARGSFMMEEMDELRELGAEEQMLSLFAALANA